MPITYSRNLATSRPEARTILTNDYSGEKIHKKEVKFIRSHTPKPKRSEDIHNAGLRAMSPQRENQI